MENNDFIGTMANQSQNLIFSLNNYLCKKSTQYPIWMTIRIYLQNYLHFQPTNYAQV